jgi:integrase
VGRKIGLDRLGWHTFRHSYRSMLDVCGAPIGVQQKLMRHAQVSAAMRYGNAYMTENERRMVRCADGSSREEKRSGIKGVSA